MKEKVAVATVKGKAYFLIVNELREQRIPFVSLVPGESIPTEVKVVFTTEREKPLVNHPKVLIFPEDGDIENLVNETKRILDGKEAYDRIVIGVDPGEVIGMAVIADGKVIEQNNCFSPCELVKSAVKFLRNLNFSLTSITVKIGNGVPIYKEIVETLDVALPQQVNLEIVGEEGTNKPSKENRHSRKIRHISSAIRIAARTGYIFPRGKAVAADSRIQ